MKWKFFYEIVKNYGKWWNLWKLWNLLQIMKITISKEFKSNSNCKTLGAKAPRAADFLYDNENCQNY